MAHSPGPIGTGATVWCGVSTRYYEEAEKASIIPESSRGQPGVLIGVGPGPDGLPRINLPRTLVNKGMKEGLTEREANVLRG